MTKKTMSPHIRAALNYEQGLEESGYYKKGKKSFPVFYIWLAIIIAAVLTLVMYSHDRAKKNPVVIQKTISHDYPVTQRDIDYTKMVETSWQEHRRKHK